MSLTDLTFEREKLNDVRRFIDSEIERLNGIIVSSRELAKTEGADFNMYNPNGGMYSGIELTNVHYEMEKQFAAAASAELDIDFLRKNRLAPYFARIDFKPDTGRPQSVYIGLRTLQDPDTYKMVICDWRAPISSLFYDDFDGKASFEAPRGRITGDLMLKRQFRFKDGELDCYIDSSLKIDDSILRDVLSGNANQHLKVIVNSIQREQNKAIRFAELKNLLVCGPAGSGKTSVGFHRLAFLLYRSRRELTSAEIVMFSNNDIFSSYVADVIPELGEMPINYADFYSVFKAEIPEYNIEDYYSLAETLIKGDKLRKRGCEIKNSEKFLDEICDFALDFEPDFKDIKYAGNIILSKDELALRYESDTESSSKAKAERICAYAVSKIDEYFTANHDAIYEKLDAESAIDEDTAKLVKQRRRSVKQTALDMMKTAAVADAVTLYLRAVGKYAEKYGEREALTRSLESMKRGVLQFEDALCVVWIKCALGTAAALSGVKHVLIDEAQDMSLLQHRILLKMFPQALFTLLADGNQAILPSVNTVDVQALKKLYNAEYMYLDRSYRSTKQINSAALELLPESARYEVFERDGDEVICADGEKALKETVADMCKQSRSVCVITKTAAQAKSVYDLLKADVPGLRLCDSKNGVMTNDPTVMPLALTKGLEFDCVAVCGKAGDFDGEENKHYKYMAVTRALHRLAIVKLHS